MDTAGVANPVSARMFPTTLAHLTAGHFAEPELPGSGWIVQHNRALFVIHRARDYRGHYYTVQSDTFWTGYRIADSLKKAKALVRFASRWNA